MALELYTYTIVTDFPNAAVDSGTLTTQIAASAITVALDHIDTGAGTCFIYFKAALSEGEETILDGIAAAHTGIPAPQACTLVHLDSPETLDGKPIIQTTILPQGSNIYLTGTGDGETLRGGGNLIALTKDEAGDATMDVGFLDTVVVLDGVITFEGAQINDYLSVEVVVPATAVVANGTNTGNCNLVDCPACPGVPAGAHIIVPAAGNGAYDVDLEDANLVPSHMDFDNNPTGFFDWSDPYYGRGAITINVTQTGSYHLVDQEVKLLNYGNKCPLLGAHILSLSEIYAISPKQLLPHWKGRFILHNGGHSGLKCVACLKLARYISVN